MGFPTPTSTSHTSASSPPGEDQIPNQEQQHQQDRERIHRIVSDTGAETGERWGDEKTGRWNGGVNAEEGLGGGKEKGWDVVELGAG